MKETQATEPQAITLPPENSLPQEEHTAPTTTDSSEAPNLAEPASASQDGFESVTPDSAKEPEQAQASSASGEESLLHDAPVALPYREPEQPNMGELIHWLISDHEDLDHVLLNPKNWSHNLQSLLLLTFLGLGLHGFCVGWLAQTTHTIQATGTLSWMPIVFVGSFVGSMIVCLPSFYFYTQLAGLDMSLAIVGVFASRVLAKTAVLLFGLLPFYVALALSTRYTPLTIDDIIVVGFLLPFVVGFWGLRTLYYAFQMLNDTFPKQYQHRGNFLLRTVIAWGGMYLVVAPVALLSMSQSFGL